MVFSSIIFLFYFLPIFFLIYFITNKRFKNGVLLIGSIIFYSWGGPVFIFVILLTTFIDFFLVRIMAGSESSGKRKLFLVCSLSINLGLLFFFKYSNFLIENINVLGSLFNWKPVPWMKLLLPIGISFYTFESVTYVVDVYRKVHPPLKSFWKYQLYILLFPKLIAGPIVRYHEISGQITNRDVNDTVDFKLTGFLRFIIGLSKKVLIANTLGAAADVVFATNTSELSTSAAWIGALCYTFQIYFDFSGYSDMALGLGRMLGFRFPENFNSPYISQSITEFWRRWHISLGNWMRNYLYIPLGGNRVKSGRLYFNLWIVFLASGLWHGASWNFVIWGAWHGTFLIMERLFLNKLLAKTFVLLRVIYTFLVVLVGWVFFRTENFQTALGFLHQMFSFHATGIPAPVDLKLVVFLLLAIFFSFFMLFRPNSSLHQSVFYSDEFSKTHIRLMPAMIIALVVAICGITANGFNPFIYFRF